MPPTRSATSSPTTSVHRAWRPTPPGPSWTSRIYYPFGGERVFTDTLADQNYKFTSKERDFESASQLDYFVARHYAWRLGRFLQADEFAGGPVDAFSSNDPLPPGPLPYADITNPNR